MGNPVDRPASPKDDSEKNQIRANAQGGSDALHRELQAETGKPGDKVVAKADVQPETDEQKLARFQATAEDRWAKGDLFGRLARMPAEDFKDAHRVITQMTA